MMMAIGFVADFDYGETYTAVYQKMPSAKYSLN